MEVSTIANCHICSDGIPVDALCYRIEGRVYCPRCVTEAACFAEEEGIDADCYDGFAANWEVIGIRRRGGFTERTVREKTGVTRKDRADDVRKGVQ